MRSIQLIRPLEQFDPQIMRVLLNSLVNELPAIEWLVGQGDWQRKACLLNLLAKLRTVPNQTAPLIKFISRIIEVKPERIYFEADTHILMVLQNLAALPTQPFYAEGYPKADIHKLLLDSLEQHGLGHKADYTLWSFRQEGRRCMQCVVAAPSVSNSICGVDCDIDLGDPLQDLDGFFIHMGELMKGGLTDAMDLHDALRKQPTGEMLYYTVVGTD